MTRSSDAGRVVLGSLLYTAGSAILYVLPAYLAELSTQLGINEAQMGSITGVENLGIALASLLSMLWLRRFDRRWLAAGGALFCVLLNLMAFRSRSVQALIATRFLTGCLGEGLLFSLAFVVLGSTRQPDRAFGIGMTAVVMFGSCVLGASTYLDRVPWGTGVLLPLAIVPVAIFFALRWMPSEPAEAGGREESGSVSPIGWLAMLAVAGMAIWFAAPGAFWTFAESAATARHIPAQTISIALALGNAAGLLGSVIAAWQGARRGRFWPILMGSAFMCLSVVGYRYSTSAWALTLALSAFNIFWNYTTVYEMALVAVLDAGGRAVFGMSAAQVIGFAAGGFLSGLVITGASYDALPALVTVFAALGFLALLPCFRAIRQRLPRY